MNETEFVTLTRDVEAILIPHGTPISLHTGDMVRITQTLGGSYTVICNGIMARIEAKDADALGKNQSPISNLQSSPAKTATGPVNEKTVWEQLKTCFDPEIPVNIVDLGLVYDMKITPLPDNGNRVDVKMTLTAPGCGMGPVLQSDVQRKLLAIENVTEANIELVWDPPWNQTMLTDAAKLQLGLM